MILHYIESMQVDIAGICEVNLDLVQQQVKYTLIQKAKQMDRHINLSMSCSPTQMSDSINKKGRTITITRGNYSGRVVQTGKDKLGRWSYVILNGKNNIKVKIIAT